MTAGENTTAEGKHHMEKGIQINSLEIQNVKRIKAVKIDCSGSALTVIGGRNGQGKTSVLDSIAYALGGERSRPSNLKREGSVANAEIKVTMSNGLVVERKGKNAALKVTDPAGGKGGQQLLKDFVSQLAIDLPKFLYCSGSEKTKMLLSILGIGDELEALEKQEQGFYDKRHTLGQIADRKKKFAEEMPCFDDVPEKMISASELIKSQQEILARNGENQKKRDNLASLERAFVIQREKVDQLYREYEEATSEMNSIESDLETARKSTEQLQDESTAELEKQLSDIEQTNAKISANLDKAKAEEDAKGLQAEYDVLTSSVEAVRRKRMELLEGANLPLPGLTVEGGNLIYNGQQWDCMSGAEQLRVGTAIARQLNPACGFVLLDKAEQFDVETLREFGAWLEAEDLQAICTRVSTGDECSIIIEDGAVEGVDEFTETKPASYVQCVGRAKRIPTDAPTPKFIPGTF